MLHTCEADHRGHRGTGAIEVNITELQKAPDQSRYICSFQRDYLDIASTILLMSEACR